MDVFDILTENGAKTGKTKERNAVHRDGDWHGSVHIWVIQKGNVLLQKRSASKDSFPLCYDIACTGHIDAGEEPLEAALRELKEELGLTVCSSDLCPLFSQKLSDLNGAFISNEINSVYLLRDDLDATHLVFPTAEIVALQWEAMQNLYDHLRQGDASYCIRFNEYQRVIKMIGSF